MAKHCVPIGDVRSHSCPFLSGLTPQSLATIRSLPETVRFGIDFVNPKPPAHGSRLDRTTPVRTPSSRFKGGFAVWLIKADFGGRVHAHAVANDVLGNRPEVEARLLWIEVRTE